jgi:hypothetical protein
VKKQVKQNLFITLQQRNKQTNKQPTTLSLEAANPLTTTALQKPKQILFFFAWATKSDIIVSSSSNF